MASTTYPATNNNNDQVVVCEGLGGPGTLAHVWEDEDEDAGLVALMEAHFARREAARLLAEAEASEAERVFHGEASRTGGGEARGGGGRSCKTLSNSRMLLRRWRVAHLFLRLVHGVLLKHEKP